jgi:hypothetical protein
MVFIYKNLVRETEDDSKDARHRTSGMIDYDSFKKAIVRISVMAQEKLDPNATSANEDLLKKRLQQDRRQNEEKSKQKEKMLTQLSKQDEKKK